MKFMHSFRLIGVLAALLILAILYIFLPAHFTDPLFVVTALLFAGSVGGIFYWRIGRDPATSGLGFALGTKPFFVPLAFAALVATLLGWEKLALSLDLLWAFLLVFYLTLGRTVVNHIKAVQVEHRVSSWYEDALTRLDLLDARMPGAAPEVRKAYEAVREVFRFSNRRTASEAESREHAIDEMLVRWESEIGAPDAFLATAEHLKVLLSERDALLVRLLNRKDQ